MIEVRYDRISLGINEKKVLTPTMRMVEMALSNVGFRDGVWVLRSPHRTRKKGAERFRAIRMDGMGLRIRCKPAGNDTCYEWTLMPPDGVDRDLLFTDLCGLHPKDLRLVRSAPSARGVAAVALGMRSLMVDEPPPALPIRTQNRSELIRGYLLNHEGAKNSEVVEHIKREHELEVRPSLVSVVRSSMKEASASHEEVAESVAVGAESVERKFAEGSLTVSGLGDPKLRSGEVLDRALIAIGEAMGDASFICREDCSREVVKRLGIDSLVAGGGSYDSVQGAMKSLMTNVCNEGYFERVSCERKTGKGFWTKGYRITDKGRERFAALTKDEEMEAEFKASLDDAVAEPRPADEDRIARIKGLIDEREALKKQIEELGTMIEEFRKEGEDEDLVLSGLRKAEEEKAAQRQALDAEIARIRKKIEDMESKATKAGRDMRDLEAEMRTLTGRKKALEESIFSPAGS